MTTGIQRLVAAINGDTSDRIPIFCNLIDQGARTIGMSLKEYYTRGEYVAEGQIKMREKYGYDNVWSLFYVGKEVELLGQTKVLYSDYGPPNLAEYPIKSYEDIEKLEVPDNLMDHPEFQETLNCLKLLKKEVGGKYPICSYLTASMSLPVLLMGIEKWMELLLNGPESVRDELLTKCSQFYQKELEAHRSAGADCLLYSNPFGSTDMVSMKLFDNLVMPWMENDLLEAGTDGVIYYCGSSPFNNVIDKVIKRLGITNFYLSPLSDVAEGKEIIGNRGLTCGVINDIKMIDWSPEQVRQEVKNIIEAGMKNSRFLFGTLVMPLDIPEENIRSMMEAAVEYGSWGQRSVQ